MSILIDGFIFFKTMNTTARAEKEEHEDKKISDGHGHVSVKMWKSLSEMGFLWNNFLLFSLIEKPHEFKDNVSMGADGPMMKTLKR